MNRIILIFTLITSFLITGIDFAIAQEVAGGLRFYSQENEFAKRTSFTLFNDYQSVTDSVRLDFDFKIYDSERFGYIFRIIDKASENSETSLCHFLCHPEFSEDRNTLFFIQNNKKSGKILILKKDKKWIPFSLKINCLTKTATVNCNDSTFRFQIDLPEHMEINVVFGLLLRNNAEVAAFDIKDVRFKISQKKEYFWPLQEISGNIANDTKHGIRSEVRNPDWLIKRHFYWNKIFDGRADVMAGIDFDQKSQNILLVNQDSIVYFDVLSNITTSVKYARKRPFARDTHFSIINPKTNELISYDFHFLKANGEKDYSTYHTEKQMWTIPDNSQDQEENHLHLMFWNNDTSNLIKFGGYAHYKFFNDFKTYDFATGTWKLLSLEGDRVYPRSHSAIGKNSQDQNYYLFGGMGNKDGEQVLGVENYYDLYKLDFIHFKSQKIWEFDDKTLVFIPRSQMIIEPSDSSGYILCNQSDKQDAPLCLYKFSLKQPQFQVVSDSLPSGFYNIADNAFLFKNNQLNELYCVIRQTIPGKTESRVSIFKLNFPPTQLTVKGVIPNSSFPFYLRISLLCLILLILLIYLIYHQRLINLKVNELQKVNPEILPESRGADLPLLEQTEINSHVQEPELSFAEEPISEFHRPRSNAIWLLGKFAIYDRKGNNITHLCSSKIKSLLFLVLLRTLYEEGISSDELSDILWPGMDKSRTKNNRSVTMNHLRKIFEDMDGIELVHEDRNWKISLGKTIYIDLFDLTKKLSDKEINAAEIVRICSLGNLLPDEKNTELDKYKGDFETQIIEILIRFADEFLNQKDYASCYKVTNIIHNHYDELNERALQIKLMALTNLRHFNKARQEYDNFCQRFKLLMAMEFTIPFNRLVN